jgi:hypothetical protein
MANQTVAGYWLDRRTYERLRLCLIVDDVMDWSHGKGLSIELLDTATPTHFKVQSDEDAQAQCLD